MAKKHTVSFIAKKKVSVPAKIKFETKAGPVAFKGHKTVKKAVKVSFKAKDK
jgi:hypothetical protein